MTDQIKNLVLEVFDKTGLKVPEDDPIILLFLVQDKVLNNTLERFQNNLNDLSDAILSEIKEQQSTVLSGFDEKKVELEQILNKLEDQKAAIVADVWQKLDKRISDKIHKQLSEDMQAIANNANNKINNQRNMFVGGAIGLILGVFFTITLFAFT